MALNVGDIVEGVVSNLVKFGAFVSLEDGNSGLIHISEISNSYVENLSDFLEKGQKVKVKVLSVEEGGKIALSMKAIEDKPKQESSRIRHIAETRQVTEVPFEKKENIDMNFEDKLSKFLKESNEKIEQARSREKQKQSRTRSRNRF